MQQQKEVTRLNNPATGSDVTQGGGESRWWRSIERRVSRKIRVGNIEVGGDAPISVQTMTNSVTSDIAATLRQIIAAANAGADLVRVSCPDQESTTALATIVGKSPVPIIADIHFHYRRAIEAAKAGAACLRINPGNIGNKARVREVVQAAQDNDCAIRIGVNAGSLERDLLEQYRAPCPEAMVASANNHAAQLLDLGFDRFKISLKASEPLLAIAAYRQLASSTDHPLHLGITEAGVMLPGSVKSAFGLGLLLSEGIGDTLRVSLTDEITQEVRVGNEILKMLGLRRRGVTIIACPSCARQQFDVLAVVRKLEQRFEHIRTPLTVSVIGCVVNGPGEAKQADIGFAGGGKNTHQVYVSGVPAHRLLDEDIVQHLVALVEKKAQQIEQQAH